MGWQGVVALLVFATAILLIAVDAINLTLAVIVAAGILVASGVTKVRAAVGYVAEAHETIALFFGGMVLVRAFVRSHPNLRMDWGSRLPAIAGQRESKPLEMAAQRAARRSALLDP